MNNPLCDYQDLPPFSQIKSELIAPALKTVLTENRNELAKLLKQKSFTWDNLIAPLEEMQDRLHKAWSPVSHLHSVMNSPELREAYQKALPELTKYYTEISQNKSLFEAVEQISTSEEFSSLDAAQQKAIENELRDFKLAGVHLNKDKQKQYEQLQTRLVELTTQFENNVLDATNHWQHHVIDKKALKGLPEMTIHQAEVTAKEKNLEGWVLSLDFPVYYAVMSYSDNADLRKIFYKAYSTRASDQGPNAGKWDNSGVMLEILKIRKELAELLEFNNYSEYSLATKMADTPNQVNTFLHDLAKHTKPFAKKELTELKDFIKKTSGHDEINAWDLTYYSEKLKQQLFDISQEDLRPYFPEPAVMQGLFSIIEKLYNVQIEKVDGVDTWHKDVNVYAIYRNKQLIGRFYTDLYARANKRGGAWMDECILHRKTIDDKLQTPVAYLTCNFSQPKEGLPCLMTHDEVVTVFHETGHCLHHLLTNIEYSSVSGINGVPWDAVELPSQFLENWAWEKEAVPLFSKHYKTGEPLPGAMLDKLIEAKNFQAGLGMLRQLEFSIFDFELHQQNNINSKEDIQTFINKNREEIAVIMPPEFNRFQHSFSHIFAGGYAAGYYSYKWAEVLSCDAFARFEEEGIFNSETASDFLNHILSQGGSDEAMNLFKRFRGREPEVGHLLRHSGLE